MRGSPEPESTPGRAKWLEAQAKRAEIASLDRQRAALLAEVLVLEGEARRLGQTEGWHG